MVFRDFRAGTFNQLTGWASSPSKNLSPHDSELMKNCFFGSFFLLVMVNLPFLATCVVVFLLIYEQINVLLLRLLMPKLLMMHGQNICWTAKPG